MHSFLSKHIFHKHTTSMSQKIPSSLLELPVELVYYILREIDVISILFSLRNVCTRLNAITDSYYRYQVTLKFKNNDRLLVIKMSLNDKRDV